jgi:uncharacterized protein YaaN involved in tellurite resistance
MNEKHIAETVNQEMQNTVASEVTQTSPAPIPSESTQQNAVVNNIAPDVPADLSSTSVSLAEDRAKIGQLMAEINMTDTKSILFFGSKAQEQLTVISDKMLDGVKNKDAGPVGHDLNDMIATIRGFDIDELDPTQKPGFFSRLLGKTKPVVKFLQQYEEVRKQIDGITDKLEIHKTTLLKDITSLDRLYAANLEYFHALETYIAAGEERLKQLDENIIPEKAQLAENSAEMILTQELRDLRSARDDLERRVHDLRLTRQVAMQSLPGIRLVQENDKGLVNKINSTIVNTIPLWRQQLATAVTIYRSAQAADTIKAATDLTNQLLQSNAETLKQANAETRKQIERGVFDIETIKKANQLLIETIQESLQIADQGKKARSEALVQLQECETQLRKTLAST